MIATYLCVRTLRQSTRKERPSSRVGVRAQCSRSLYMSLERKRVDVEPKILIRAPHDLARRERVELDGRPQIPERVDAPGELVEVPIVLSCAHERDSSVLGRVENIVRVGHGLSELDESLDDRGKVVLLAFDRAEGGEVGLGVVGGEAEARSARPERFA